MKYFSFASKFSVFTNCKGRTISYKVRKSLVYMLSKMEKDPKFDSAKMYLTEKTSQTNCPRFAIQVLGNGALESSGVVVQTGIANYFFNCGEGVQRCASSYGVKLMKTYALFITSHSWTNIGGIVGLALSLQSAGVKNFLIYGPPAVRKVISGWESFVMLKSLSVKVITDDPELLFDDGCLKVQFVPLYQNFPKSTSTSFSNLFTNTDIEQNAISEHSERNLSHSEEEHEMYALCYICKSPSFGQHINVSACLEKGLEIGPLLNILRNHKIVTLNDGKVIHLDEVCTSEGQHKIFIVVECPTAEYLNSLLSENKFAAYQYSTTDAADLVIHFTPPEVMNDLRYQEWMLKFPKTTKHLVINADNSCADLIAVHHVQTKLNYLNQKLFPVLSNGDLPVVKEEFSGKMGKTTFNIFSCTDEETEKNIAGSSKKNTMEFSAREVFKSNPKIFEDVNGLSFIRPFPTLSLTYHPKQKYDIKHNIAYDPLNCINEIKSLDNVNDDLDELADFTRKWESSDECKNLPEYPNILFLGTGSSVPSRYRSASAILIFLNENNVVLLDCGEGTYQQLVRLFGKDKMPEFMEKLKMIFVSHHHADHHLGMVNILIMRQKLLQKDKKSDKIILLVPPTISDWLYMCEGLYNSFLCDTNIVMNSTLGKQYCALIESLNKIGISNLRVCRVEHCRNSSGISITDHNNFKITYSGDCKPSTTLIDTGEDSDILIHEATFEDELEAMAKQKYHSTVSQAIEMGRKMNAKYTILTHFSQRYAHVPQIADNIPENVGIAFDNMMVSQKTLPVLKKMLKFYKLVFADKIEKLNSKTLKRSLKREGDEQHILAKIKITS